MQAKEIRRRLHPGRAWLSPTRCAVLMAMLWLTACATYHPHPLTASESAQDFQQRSLNTTALRDFMQRHGAAVKQWPLHTWSPQDLMLATEYFHPSIAAARARWRLAQAAVTTAGAYPNPTLQLTPQYTTNATPGVSPWTVDAGAVMSLLTAGKQDDRVAAARADAAAARFDVTSALWKARARTRAALLILQATLRRRPLLATQVRDSKAILDAVDQGVRAGQTPPFEAFDARRAWNRTRQTQVQNTAALTQARGALAAAIGVPVHALEDIHIDSPAWSMAVPPVPSRQRLQTVALTRRADIRAAVLQYAASQSRLKLAIAGQYPNISIGPGYQWDQGAHRWSLGLSLTLPVFNQHRGPIAQARARRDIKADHLRMLQEQLAARLDHTLAKETFGRRTLALARQRVVHSRRQLRDTHAAFAAGQIGRVVWLRARLQLARDRLARIKAQGQLLEARAALSALIQHSMGAPPAPATHTRRRSSGASSSTTPQPVPAKESVSP